MGYTGELCSAGLGNKNKNIVMGPDGARNQDSIAGEGQQQFVPPVPTGRGQQSVEARRYLAAGLPNYRAVA
jgi:hypothetical protein